MVCVLLCECSPRRVGGFSLLLLLSIGVFCARGAAQAPAFQGYTSCPWGAADCNRCVADPIWSVNNLRNYGDVLGFHLNGAPDVDMGHHWQGVQRPMSGGAQYLAFSRSLESGSDFGLAIVFMESRDDANGERFRSNRLNPALGINATPPPAGDKIITRRNMIGDHNHAGGMQMTGDFLAVPFEGGTGSEVVLYDLSDPTDPTESPNHIDHSSLSSQAGTASIAKLADGRFMLIIGRADANILDFYVSNTADLATTQFTHFDTWSEGELLTDIGDTEFGNYQNLNLLTKCDGTLYMVGTHQNSIFSGSEDFIDLYRVENSSGEARITKVAKRHLTCDYRGVNNCNFDAAGGIYVDPQGRLLLYGSEHDNDGPQGTTKFEEFRPSPHTASCPRIRDAWVELFDNHDFDGRSLMIDFVDRDLEDYTNFDVAEGFEDTASSVRWCIPPGGSYRLWQDKNPCSGNTLDLPGSGLPQQIADLTSRNFGDETSCSEWRGGPFADAGDDVAAQCANAPTAVTLDGSGSAAIAGALTYSWNAPGVSFDDFTSSAPTGRFPLGATLATLTVDGGGDTASDSVLVNVIDTLAPELTCPDALEVECSGNRSASASFSAEVQDACEGSLSPSCPLSGAAFDLGVTSVTCSASDSTGNTASCNSQVTVLDRTDPQIVCPADIVVEPASPQGTAVDFTAQGSDVCDPAPLIECPGSGDIFAVGTTTTANCSITDQSANQAQCSFNVKVLSQAELVQSLLDRVGAIGAGGVNPGVVEGLLARLTNILRMLQSGEQTATCNQLDSFIGNVRNDGAQGRLTPAQADSLALSAMNLRAALACN